MKKITRIQVLSLLRLTNTEFANLMTRTYKLITTITAEKLGLDEADVKAFGDNVLKLADMVRESRKNPDTDKLMEIDKVRDDLITFLLDNIRTMEKSPIAAQYEAALNLKPLAKTYKNIRKMSNELETQTIDGLVIDLEKGKFAPYIAAIGQTDTVAKIKKANEDYAALTESRALDNLNNQLGSAKPVREEMGAQYEYLMEVIYATNLLHPTAETAEFITRMNDIIADTERIFKQRRTGNPPVDENPDLNPINTLSNSPANKPATDDKPSNTSGK